MKRDFMFNALYISYNFQKALKHLIYKKYDMKKQILHPQQVILYNPSNLVY